MFCFLIGHKWNVGYNPHFESCERCKAVRQRRFVGCKSCSWCGVPITPPGTDFKHIESNRKCPHCDKTNRWTRDRPYKYTLGGTATPVKWRGPTLVVDFKFEDTQ